MESFRIKNIKSFKDSGTIEIKPITIFVGKNSCGKSSLLRFPAVLAQTDIASTDSPILFYGKMVDYGNYEDVIHKGEDGRISFEITYRINIRPLEEDLERKYSNIIYSSHEFATEKVDIRDATIAVSIAKIKKHLCVEMVELYIDQKNVCTLARLKGDKYSFCINYTYKDGDLVKEQHSIDIDVTRFDNYIPLIFSDEILSAVACKVKNCSLKNLQLEDIKRLQKKLLEMPDEFSDNLTKEEELIRKMIMAFDYGMMLMSRIRVYGLGMYHMIHYIGPFRNNPERVYRDPEYYSYDIGVRGENLSNFIISDYHKKSKLIGKMSDSLQKIMGYRLSVNELGSGMFNIMIEDENGFQSNIIDTGYGVSQTLPIIAQVIRSMMDTTKRFSFGDEEIGEMILIEQPELHLHPAAQAAMAELFADCVLNKKDQKIVIETHSEHLIRKLQVLVADKNNELTHDMIKVYYVDKDNTGVASVEEMSLLENGKFEKKWPTGFFDKGYLLSVELANAGR